MQKTLPTERTDRRADQIGEVLRRLERRDWWLWSTAIIVSLLLTAAVVSTALPAIKTDPDDFFRLNLNQAVRGLVGLVLLFNLYVVYQQVLIKRFRRKVAEQMIVEAGLRTRAEELEKIAIFDPSTGLYNARFLDQRLEIEVARSQRYGYPLTVAVVEIDGFARIAEIWGQSGARTILQRFANLITQNVRVADIAISLGDGEFVLLMPECTMEEVPVLLQHLGSPEVELSGQRVVIPFLVGSASYRSGELPGELLRRAESALTRKPTLEPLTTQRA